MRELVERHDSCGVVDFLVSVLCRMLAVCFRVYVFCVCLGGFVGQRKGVPHRGDCAAGRKFHNLVLVVVRRYMRSGISADVLL